MATASPSTPPPPYSQHAPLGPYLRLSHRLSLAPFAYPIIAVAFVALRFYLSLQSAKNLIQDAKELVIAGCLGAQRAATAAVSIPRWMALETNEQILNVAHGTIEAARKGINASLHSVNALVIFVIETWQSFYLCLFQFVVRGSLAAVITVTQYVEQGLKAIGPNIGTAVSSAQSGINSGVNTANGIFGRLPGFSSVAIPTLSVPVDALNVAIPDVMSSTLTKFNESLPTLDELRAELANLISIPFVDLQKKVNETFADIQNTKLNGDLLPVPAPRTVEFCNDIDLSIIDTVGDKMIRVIRSIAIALVVLVFLMMIGNTILEWYRWHALQAAVSSIQDSWVDPSAPEGQGPTPVVELTRDNLLVLHSQLENGYRTKFLAKARRMLHLQPKTTNNFAWFIAYVTYPPALMCLLIGVLGLVVVAIQLALVDPLRKEFNNLENLVIGNYTQQVADAITSAMAIDSVAYANDVNSWIDTTSSVINNDVFTIASTASDAINGTVVRYYTIVEDGIRKTFDGTVFADSITELLRCVIGNKIFRLADGLAWLKANLHINLPHVDSNVLVLKSSSVSEMATPIGNAASSQNASGGEESGILGRIVDTYEDILKGEAIIFAVFLGIWGVVVLSACLIMLWHSFVTSRKQTTAEKDSTGGGGQQQEVDEKVTTPA
ncbi:plasma membrane fusion protein prm1 [Serendipita sp. 405]|nr:plasma membrane fusion protein prm1 [Serendipita sp. 405]